MDHNHAATTTSNSYLHWTITMQLRTMASKSVDPMDWRLPLHFTGQYSLSVTCAAQIGAACAWYRPRNLPHTRLRGSFLCGKVNKMNDMLGVNESDVKISLVRMIFVKLVQA